MKRFALAILAVSFLSTHAHAEWNCGRDTGGEPTPRLASEASTIDYKKYKTSEQNTTLIPQKGHSAESPVVSEDESQIAWIGNNMSSHLPPTDLFMETLGDASSAKVINKTLNNKLNIFVKGAFTPKGELVTCELLYRFGAITKTSIEYFKTGEWEPKGYQSVISFFKDGVKTRNFTPEQFGLPNDTFLEHPRVSPDNKWLTFYTQGNKDNQGIYVFNLYTEKTFYLGNFADKHPTWSADGGKIFFHEQGVLSGTKEEIAQLGYYKLAFYDNQVAVAKRKIISDDTEEFGDAYVYQKHPAFHSGLNLVFFHARETVGGKKSLAVIDLDHPNKKPRFLKLSFNGKTVKGAKHPDVSYRDDSSLFYVGRVEGQKTDQLLRLDYQELVQIKKDFE